MGGSLPLGDTALPPTPSPKGFHPLKPPLANIVCFEGHFVPHRASRNSVFILNL